mmetsp:Transcript_13987/g.27769  ORF Transcript_13987/g.27769 Transcript_13987/m.27769 type:complete len:298 (-) Transcript_13987:229-1122(-)
MMMPPQYQQPPPQQQQYQPPAQQYQPQPQPQYQPLPQPQYQAMPPGAAKPGGTREKNRWGDGLEAPAAGSRTFFPDGWRPQRDVRAALQVFGHSEQDVNTLFDDARRQMAILQIVNVSMADSLVAAVLAYTKETPNVYLKLNMACRTPGGYWDRVLEAFRDYLYHLDRSIQALPNFSGQAFRGITDSSLSAAYRVGDVVTWQQFSSTSKVARQAFTFLVKDGNTLSGSLFVLQVLTGKELELCSEYPQEQEVLLPLNSHFRVDEHIAQQDRDRKLQVLPLLSNYDATALQLYLLTQL